MAGGMNPHESEVTARLYLADLLAVPAELEIAHGLCVVTLLARPR